MRPAVARRAVLRFVRFRDGARWRHGLLEGDRVAPIAGTPFSRWRPDGRPVDLAACVLGPPCLPSKIVAVGVNYRAHAAEFGHAVPAEPMLFLKPPSALIGPGDAIRLPAMSERVEYEAELAVVIGRRARAVPPGRALDHVLGYCCFNDVTARDLQRRDGQWARAKGFDTFAPLGPLIATGLDPSRLRVESWVNGRRRQSAPCSDMVFPVPELVSFASRVMTLEPGDVIATGTPSGVGPLAPGDRVEVRIRGVGCLCNIVESIPQEPPAGATGGIHHQGGPA